MGPALNSCRVPLSSHFESGHLIMRALLVLIFGAFCAVAMADEPLPVEQYSYAQHLDIAYVISTSEVADVCAVVPVRMTYEDSKGQRHILEYHVMGNGCSNG